MKRRIRNPELLTQPVAFSGFEDGKVSFTDLDFCMELYNELFIIGDVKHECTGLTTGQKILIERLCDKDWVLSVGIVATHNVEPPNEIVLAECNVKAYYWHGQWVEPEAPMKMKEFVTMIKNTYKHIKNENL